MDFDDYTLSESNNFQGTHRKLLSIDGALKDGSIDKIEKEKRLRKARIA